MLWYCQAEEPNIFFASVFNTKTTHWFVVHPKVILAWSFHNKLHSLGWNNNFKVLVGGKKYNFFPGGLPSANKDG